MATFVGPVNNLPMGQPGGVSAAYGVTGAVTIKGSSGILCKVSVTVAGNIALFDGTNPILSVTGAVVGTVYELEWPCQTSINSTAATTATLSVSFS